jgi:hypothetical protein
LGLFLGVRGVPLGVAEPPLVRGLPRFGVSVVSSSNCFLGRPLFPAGFLVVTNTSRPLTRPSINENEFFRPGVNSCNTLSIVYISIVHEDIPYHRRYQH